jgi:predicted DNA-binding protein
MADDKDRAITIRLPEKLHDQLKDRAEREERTVAGLLRLAARLYLRTEEPLSSV